MTDDRGPDEPTYTDGNLLDGPLSEVFVRDVTGASGRCRFCGLDAPVAQVHVWASGPGVVARCSGCDEVLVRFVQTDTSVLLDASGLAELRWAR